MTEIDVCKTIKAKAVQWCRDDPRILTDTFFRCETCVACWYCSDVGGLCESECVDHTPIQGDWVITGDDGVDVLTDAEFREQWTEGKG